MTPDAYCIHSTFEPRGPSEFQTDRHYLLYALMGTLRLEAQGKRWTLPPARAALIKSGCPITITVLSKLTSASVLFSPDFIPTPERALTVFDMTPLARELIAECRDWRADSGQLTPYSRQIFTTLANVALQLSQSPSRCVLPSPSSPELSKALSLTEAQSNRNLTFKEVAQDCGQSPRALSRRFAEEMGMTWSEALRRIRIIQAIEALAASNTSITEIALSVGYNSLSGFNAAFREVMDMTPTQYRASFTISDS